METIKLLALYLEHWIVCWSDETKSIFKPCLFHLVEDSAIPFYLKPQILLHYLKHYSHVDRNATNVLDLTEIAEQMASYLSIGYLQNMGLSRINLTQVGNISSTKPFLTGLYLYDLIFECIWKSAQVLEILRIKTGRNLGKQFKEICCKKLTEVAQADLEIFGIRLIDEVGAGIKNMSSVILAALEDSEFSEMSDYLTLHVHLLPFLGENIPQSFQNDHLFMLMTFESMCNLAKNHVYPYSFHLLPKNEAVYRTACTYDSKLGLKLGFTRKLVLKQSLTGTHDMFGIRAIILTCSSLKMSCVIFKVTNQTKLFLDEIKVSVLVGDSRKCLGKRHEFTLENFAGSTVKQLRIAVPHRDVADLTFKIDVIIPKLQKLMMEYQKNPANALLPIGKLNSLAAIGEIFDVKSITKTAMRPIPAFHFLHPLPLQSLSSVCTQEFTSMLVYASRQAKMILLAGTEVDGGAADRILPDLSHIMRHPLLLHPVVVLESHKSRSVYMRSNLLAHQSRLETLFSSDSAACVTVTYWFSWLGSAGELVGLSIRVEGKSQSSPSIACVDFTSNLRPSGATLQKQQNTCSAACSVTKLAKERIQSLLSQMHHQQEHHRRQPAQENAAYRSASSCWVCKSTKSAGFGSRECRDPTDREQRVSRVPATQIKRPHRCKTDRVLLADRMGTVHGFLGRG